VNGSVAYILMGFPRVSETFIASEIHRVEREGLPLRLYVVKPVEAREQGHRHPVIDAIEAEPHYLPDPKGLTKPLHAWRYRDLREFMPALGRAVRRRPHGVARATKTAFGQAFRDRKTRFSGPRKIYVKELVQAITLADALAPDVRHLHAHFAHGTTTITWLAACITGLPFSFTGHARDIYAPELNPKGWLRRKLNAARFVVTCTAANVEHLRAIAPRARIHLVYHGLSADFTTLLARDDDATPTRNGRLRVLGVGRLVAKKGFDVLVDACAVLQARGVPFDALIVGQDDKDGEALRAKIAASGVDVRLPGAVGPEDLLAEYRRAGALCMPCRLLPSDRDGIPNVLVEAMAAGAPVVATNVSGIPELVEHEVNGLLVAPEDPEALADALMRLHADPELTRRLTDRARETVATHFDGERSAHELARLFREVLC
jgi:glycosyltransferase involved in cell wall biosynthesis